MKIDLVALEKRRRQFNANEFKRRSKLERACCQKNCVSGEKASNNHQISESQLSQIAFDGQVVLGRPPMDLVLLKNSISLFREHPTKRSLTFKSFCPKCDQSLFSDLDDRNSPFDANLVLNQAFRSQHYQKYVDMVEFEARLESFNKIGIVRAIAPAAYTKDRRVAANAEEEARYVLSGHEFYLNLLKPETRVSDDFYVQTVKVLENPPFRLTSSSYLNAGFFGEILGLDWNNAGKVQPKIFWFLQRYNEETYLAWVVRKRFKEISNNIRDQVLSLTPAELFFQIFRYGCFSNLGFAMDPKFYNGLSAAATKSLREIKRIHAKEAKAHKSLKDWRKWKYPEEFGTLTVA